MNPTPNCERAPAIALPLHDPDGLLRNQVQAVLPGLEASFAQVYLGVTADTMAGYASLVEELARGMFVSICPIQGGLGLGEQFLTLYRFAVDRCPPEQVLHLAFPDRLAFAVQGPFAAAFAADMRASGGLSAPVIYQRSPAAWATHPRNYRELETALTRAGEYLFGRSLDFAWCQMAVPSGRLRQILSQVRAADMSMIAEIVLLLKDEVTTVEVDWLAWEDPLVLGVDGARLRAQREADPRETRKRLSYVIPMLQRLLEYYTSTSSAQ